MRHAATLMFAIYAGGMAMGFSAALAQPTPPASQVAPTFPMQVSSQDQQNVRQICQLAMKDVTLTLEQSTALGQYCLGLINRIGVALSPPPVKPADAPAPLTPSKKIPGASAK